MDMTTFNHMPEIKFLIVLGKMHSALFGQVNKHVKAMGINTTEFLVMYAIAANGPLTIQDIAARITVTSGNMTYTIDKLEKKGLLKREHCPDDRRRIYIDFTREGTERWKVIMVEHGTYLKELFGDIDEEDLLHTIDLMKTIGKTMDN